jgi:hypothetical protein
VSRLLLRFTRPGLHSADHHTTRSFTNRSMPTARDDIYLFNDKVKEWDQAQLGRWSLNFWFSMQTYSYMRSSGSKVIVVLKPNGRV